MARLKRRSPLLLRETVPLIVATVIAGFFAATPVPGDDKTSLDSAIVKDFDKRIQDYLKMRQPLVKEVPKLKPTTTSEDIGSHQKALSEGLRDARQTAQQGDIFTPEIATEFRRSITQTMASSNASHIRKSLTHAEPVALTLHVNDRYPAKVPLQSTPPSLLMSLPKLPKELDYRLVGNTLVLRDCDANIVVDLIPNAIVTKTANK
jgi:hypothetical protein